MQRVTCGVSPPRDYVIHKRLFDALEDLFPVSFEGRSSEDLSGVNTFILLGGSRQTALLLSAPETKCLVVQAPHGQALRCRVSTVQLTDTSALPHCLRGESLSEMENRDFVPIDCNREEQIVASKGGMILWTHRPASHEEGEIDFVAIPSTNLSNWLNIATNILGATPTTFVDPVAGQFPTRFYRISVLP